MSISLTARPTYPLPGQQHITLTPSGGGNFARLWVTSAPEGSSFRKRLDEARDKSEATRVEVHAGATGEPWRPYLEVGGVYTFLAQEYTFGATTHGGSYEGDPNSYPSETKVGSETTVTITVGQRLAFRLGVSPHNADLVMFGFGSSFQATTLIEHGIKTPAYLSPATPLAKQASLLLESEYSSSGLVGSASTIIGNPETITTTLRQTFDAHLTQSGVHYNNDTDNAVGATYDSPEETVGLAQALNRIRRNMLRHFQNDSDGTGPGSVDPNHYHEDGSGNALGYWRRIVAPPASESDPWSCYQLLANMYLLYEAHRIDTGVHQAADSTNTLSGATALLTRVGSYMIQLADISPTAPNTINQAAASSIALGALEQQ